LLSVVKCPNNAAKRKAVITQIVRTIISMMIDFLIGCRNMTHNVLQLQEVGDFGDENCLPPLNLIRSTKLHLTTEPPISCSIYVKAVV
jgi:hypothetical protein